MRQLVFIQKMKGTRTAGAVRPAETRFPKPLEICFLKEGRSERLYSGEETVVFRTSGTGLNYETVEKHNMFGVRFEIEKTLPT